MRDPIWLAALAVFLLSAGCPEPTASEPDDGVISADTSPADGTDASEVVDTAGDARQDTWQTDTETTDAIALDAAT